MIQAMIAGPGAADIAKSFVIPKIPLPMDELTTKAIKPILLIPLFFSIVLQLSLVLCSNLHKSHLQKKSQKALKPI